MGIEARNREADKKFERYLKTGMIPIDSFKGRKKILYIDMDGVVADFWKAIKTINPKIDNKKYFATEADQEKEVDAICEKNPRIFLNLPPVKGALNAVKPLFNKYDVYFLSTPMWEVPDSYSDKRHWLEKHFGELAKKRLILTNRKDLAVGDILIDDRLKNGSREFNGTFIHFGTKAFTNWKAVIKFLKTHG